MAETVAAAGDPTAVGVVLASGTHPATSTGADYAVPASGLDPAVQPRQNAAA